MAGARRASRRRYVLLVIVLTALTLITLDSRNGRSGPLGAMGRVAHTVVSPIESAVSSVASPVSDWWNGVTDSGHLKSDNRKLHEQLAALQGKEADAQRALDENKVLRAYLNLASRFDAKNVTSLIVSRDPGNFDPTLTIDKGQESGIAVDMPVVSPEGLIGKVIETWQGGSKIRVLTDPSFAVGIVTPPHGSAPQTQGIAQGQVGSSELQVQFDPGTKVLVGDDIVTSAIDTSIFPSGIPVGKVTSVTVKPGGVGVVATIRPYADIGGLQYVNVLEWVPGQGPAFKPTTTTAPSTTTSTTTTVAPGAGAVTPTSAGG